VNFLHSEVTIDEGEAVLVQLSGTEANVLVMSDSDFRNYRSGGRYNYFGGHFKRSPAVVRPPGGRWNVVVDLGGYAGKVEASVRVIH
jgi:hypothetical protein